jgi:hypothetical protein
MGTLISEMREGVLSFHMMVSLSAWRNEVSTSALKEFVSLA